MVYNENDIRYLTDRVCSIKGKTQELGTRLDRHFSIDGHLAGSIGEVFASYYYGIDLYPANNKMYDGEINGKQVQIKKSQGTGVEVKGCPEYLIVLHFQSTIEGICIKEVYNGPGNIVLDQDKTEEKTEIHMSFEKLVKSRDNVSADQKILSVRKKDRCMVSEEEIGEK